MKEMLEYKGYYGSINCSLKDNILYGKLEYITALVNYEAETIEQLKEAFQEAVDDYLETCASLGYEAELPCKGSFNVRIGHELHMKAALAAKAQGISLNEWVTQALKNAVLIEDLAKQAEDISAGKLSKHKSPLFSSRAVYAVISDGFIKPTHPVESNSNIRDLLSTTDWYTKLSQMTHTENPDQTDTLYKTILAPGIFNNVVEPFRATLCLPKNEK